MNFEEKEHSFLNLKTLKEQVYEYLREQIEKGIIKPGSKINMEETSRKLGVSKTPLRDALIQLETEGFVTIIPRKGIVVNGLTMEDIKNYYQIIGALESAALLSVAEKLDEAKITQMEQLNREMKEAIEADNFDLYYEKNLKFHNTYLYLCGNRELIKIVESRKKRLYDFPRKKGFIKEWEVASIGEHQQIVEHLKKGEFKKAAEYIRDVHWSFEVQKKFIVKYYEFREKS